MLNRNSINLHHSMKNFVNCFFFILTSLIIFSCENEIKKVNTLTAVSEKSLPIESGKNVELIYSDSALIKAKLQAAQLDRYVGEKNYMELPKGVLVIFYDEQRKEKNRLTADYGIGWDDGGTMNKMEAKRNVIVVNEKGDKLNTEHLIWDAVTKKIFTKEFVKITTKDEIIWGDGLEANQDFSEYEIKNPKGQIQVDSKELSNENDE